MGLKICEKPLVLKNSRLTIVAKGFIQTRLMDVNPNQ
jgi:hypothetical protein